MSIHIADTIIRHDSIAGTTIGLYNINPEDIPFVDELIKHSVMFHVIDNTRPIMLDYLIDNKLKFVLAHTPDRVSRVVDYVIIRIMYVDVKDLTHNDIINMIHRQLLYPRPDDSDVNYHYVNLHIDVP